MICHTILLKEYNMLRNEYNRIRAELNFRDIPDTESTNELLVHHDNLCDRISEVYNQLANVAKSEGLPQDQIDDMLEFY